MPKLTASQVQIAVQFRNDYLRKSASRPSLYVSNINTLTIVLPVELLDFANRAAGHSGFNAGSRAVGIRRVVSNAQSAIRQIFGSVESLVEFIETSECDYEGREVQTVIQSSPEESFIPAREQFWTTFTIANLKDLRNKYGVELVNTAMEKLTFTEMRNLFLI